MRVPLVALLVLASGCIALPAPSSEPLPAAEEEWPAPATAPAPTPAPTTAPTPAPAPNATGPAENATAPPPLPPPPRVDVLFFNGSIALGLLGHADPQGRVEHAFPVPAGVRLLVGELSWSGTGTDLDAVLALPGGCGDPTGVAPANYTACRRGRAQGESDARWHRASGGSAGAPDSPSRVEVAGEAVAALPECAEGCEWIAVAFANSAAQASYSFRVEVHHAQ